MKSEYELAPDYEKVGGTAVTGRDFVARAVAACEVLGGKANQLADVGLGADDVRRLAAASPDVLAEKLDEIEQLTAFVLVRLRALVDEAREKR